MYAINPTLGLVKSLIDRLGIFGGGSDLPPLTPEQQAAMEVNNALNMAQGDLYGDGENEGFLETVGPTFEEAVRKVQSLDDSEEKTDLLSILANNTPYDFTDLTPASITGIDSSDYDADVLSNPLLVNPLLVEQAANTGPKPLDELSPEEIMEVYKDRKIDDLIRDFPTDEGGKFPFDFVQSILINSANEGDKNAAQILMNSGVPIAGPEGAFDGDGPAAGTGDPAASGAEGTGTPTGGTPQGQTVTPQGETSTPQGSTPTPQGGTPQGGTPQGGEPTGGAGTVDTGTGSTPTVSTGSVLDQSGTENVNVDDQPIGLPNIPISTPIQPEKKAGMIMQISQSAPIVETLFDDILFEPKFTKLDNIPDFNLPSGLLRTLV